MYVILEREMAKKVEELASDLGFTIDEMVNQILLWYFEDCEKENNM